MCPQLIRVNRVCGGRKISGLAKGNSRFFPLSFLAWSCQPLFISDVHGALRADKRCHGPMRKPLNDFVITPCSPTEQDGSHLVFLGSRDSPEPRWAPFIAELARDSDSPKAHLKREPASPKAPLNLHGGYIPSTALPPQDRL